MEMSWWCLGRRKILRVCLIWMIRIFHRLVKKKELLAAILMFNPKCFYAVVAWKISYTSPNERTHVDLIDLHTTAAHSKSQTQPRSNLVYTIHRPSVVLAVSEWTPPSIASRDDQSVECSNCKRCHLSSH